MKSERGFTQVELIVGAIALTILMGGITSLLAGGVNTYQNGVTTSDLERTADRTVSRIADLIEMSGAEVLGPVEAAPKSGTGVTLQRNEGWVDGKIRWGAPTSIELVPDPSDPFDGADNNHNGMVDEGMVMLTIHPGEPGERRIVLTRFVSNYLEGEMPDGRDDNGNGLVDERGLSFDVDHGLWTIRLTLSRRDARGRLVSATAETSIRPRN